MKGTRHSVVAVDGVCLGLLTAGSGPPLLLVHGGFGQIESWAPIWELLLDDWRVTAMDRRGRGSSGDGSRYDISLEYSDIAAVAKILAEEGRRIDVFAHSFGATCAMGAANRGAPFRQMMLYEPAGPETAPLEWVNRASALVVAGKAGAAMGSFLSEIIGLSAEEIEVLKGSSLGYDILSVVAATLPREARALAGVDWLSEAQGLTCPVSLLMGANSPRWAGHITRAVAQAVPAAEVTVMPGVGHEALNAAPELIVRNLRRLLE